MSGLRVAWNDNIDVLQGRIGVAESDDGDVNVRRFGDGLVIRKWVSHDQKPRFTESCLSLISESTRGETTSNRRSSGVTGEFQDCALAEWARRDGVDLKRETF